MTEGAGKEGHLDDARQILIGRDAFCVPLNLQINEKYEREQKRRKED
jgi:hypothetical protein